MKSRTEPTVEVITLVWKFTVSLFTLFSIKMIIRVKINVSNVKTLPSMEYAKPSKISFVGRK